ncbi:RHS repeat-associated core domain-containing protein [Spirochaeta thermophila]|uniref:RHS repeat-associated core domain-containing protein n=1 Tax=Winmispira thermophila (strain ATCC 49972 / DSM 6192 / RI 19.B1) TaxID=665571 RepID=E0RRE5_WINT6|nr:RHS repeat-associated core domain-containing protein [Spirochaeta thermophila]ADN01646.1 hypothetical protein STHERM_c06880 [Spirochaeta thermophila DSM 6192]
MEWRWAHDEWAGRPEVRYRYAGKEWDEESGLYYFGARYYRAEVGLWLSPDPEGVRLVSPWRTALPGVGTALPRRPYGTGTAATTPYGTWIRMGGRIGRR